MLSIKNLTRIYKTKGGDDTKALDNVTLDFPETGMIFLLGKSGSGKSTLLNLIGGLDFPTSGEIILKGRSSKDFSQSDFDSYRNTYIGFIFQEYNILNEFNVEQNIALAIELQGKKVTKEAVDALLAQVDLTGYGKRKPNTLSGGQKQRIAIARALIKQPNIIMADEPTGALDSKTGEQVFETLKKLSSDKLVIVVSHDRDFAERFGDRIIELKDGQILSDQTKHSIEAKVISDNVTIINQNAIKINDASQLSKKDFDQLYASLIKNKGTVFISSGENADKSMKVARISENGQSDEFKETEPIALKQYDASQTKFIRSKMPINKSTKMGLSSLKTKPIRLAFTMLLSVISFTMFGVASGLMLYNSGHTYSEALRKTDYKAERMRKIALGRSVGQEIDSNGRVVRESSYSSEQEAMFGVQEIKELNNNNVDLLYVPIGQVDNNLCPTNLTMKKNSEFYSQYYRLNYISDIEESDFKKLGYELYGNYPVNDDEILIPKIYADMLIDSEATNKKSFASLIGDKMYFNLSKGTKQLKVTGFYDAGDLPERYWELINEKTTLDRQQLADLSDDLPDYFKGSFNSVAFVTSNFFDEYARNYNYNYNYVQPVIRRGIVFSTNEIGKEDYGDISNYGDPYYTDEIYQKNKSSMTLYDMDEKEISGDVIFKDDEVYLPYYAFNNVAYTTRNSFLQDFMDIGLGFRVLKFMPTYYAYYSENLDVIEMMRNMRYEDPSLVVEFYETFKDEYQKAYLIDRYVDEYRSRAYDTMSEQDKALFDKCISYETPAGSMTANEINSVYNTMYNNFDSICKNFITYNYFQTVYSNNEQLRVKIDKDGNLLGIYNKDYHSWTDQEVQRVKTFLEENCQNGLSKYDRWDNYLRGYTFKEFVPVGEYVFKPNKNIVYYYKSYNGNSGSLKVVGYYKMSNDNGDWLLLTNNFLEHNSMEESSNDSGTHWEWHFESDYEEPKDARYANVMVKTDYTQDQVNFMLKSNNKNLKYEMTSSRYMAVEYIVSLISILQKVFFWVGVGFGAFSALMLLNFITVSISSKKRDIGILRAIGARKSDVFKIFFSESLFIGAVCALLAIIFTFIAEFFLDRYFVTEIGISILQFSIITVGLILAVAVVISFIATIIPVVHSSRKPPVESIRAL